MPRKRGLKFFVWVDCKMCLVFFLCLDFSNDMIISHLWHESQKHPVISAGSVNHIFIICWFLSNLKGLNLNLRIQFHTQCCFVFRIQWERFLSAKTFMQYCNKKSRFLSQISYCMMFKHMKTTSTDVLRFHRSRTDKLHWCPEAGEMFLFSWIHVLLLFKWVMLFFSLADSDEAVNTHLNMQPETPAQFVHPLTW